MAKPSIFLSYSHKDEKWKERLERHLKVLEYQGEIKAWSDRDIRAGDDWQAEIEQALDTAAVGVLLISTDFLTSEYIQSYEVPRLLKRRESGEILLIPLIIEACLWQEIPWLSSMLARPTDGKALAAYSKNNIEAELAKLAKEIADKISGKTSTPQKQKPSRLPACQEEQGGCRKVWYLDDDPQWLARFQDRHGDDFEIRVFNNVIEILNNLRNTTPEDPAFPDIVLVDLYAPLPDFTVDRSLLEETQRKLEQFFTMERRLRKYVDDAWEPSGVEVVDSVREFHGPEELPIAIHTQRGLVLLKDHLMRDLESMQVNWLLKNRFSPETDQLILARMIRRSQRSEGRKILIVDDNPNFLKAFCERHREAFDIHRVTNHGEVLPTLLRLKSEDRFPNLLLVDLYYPRDLGSSSQEKINLANQKLSEFSKFECELQNLVRRTHEPIGMQIIEEIRRMYNTHELPLLVYTLNGLLMLDNKDIHKIEHWDAGWLLKNRYGVGTEQARIFGQITRSREAWSRNSLRLSRKV